MFGLRTERRAARRGFSLVEILVVCVLLVALGAGLSYFYLGGGGKGKNGERKVTPISKAKDTVCQSNLSQIRQMITMQQQSDPDESKPPASLDELRGLPGEMKACPDGKEPYQYDPQTGQVRCIHPGHEKL